MISNPSAVYDLTLKQALIFSPLTKELLV